MLYKYPKLDENLSEEEYITYSKQIVLKQVGIEGQRRLRNTKILVIGAGGLGCPAILYLAKSGIGCIGIIDKDCIEQSNLNRQILYNRTNIGQQKTECAKEKIQIINENTRIVTHNWKIDNENSLEVVRYYDLIIDATDSFNTRLIIDKACRKLHRTYIHGAINEFEGEIAILNYKNGLRYEHLYKNNLDILENSCNRDGVMGISTGYIGLLQATETIKTILGLEKTCKNTIIRYRILGNSTQKKLINPSRKLQKDTIIHDINTKTEKLSILLNDFTIDLREEKDFRKKHIKRAINIPLINLHLFQTKTLILNIAKNRNITIYCNEKEKLIDAYQILNKYRLSTQIRIMKI